MDELDGDGIDAVMAAIAGLVAPSPAPRDAELDELLEALATDGPAGKAAIELAPAK